MHVYVLYMLGTYKHTLSSKYLICSFFMYFTYTLRKKNKFEEENKINSGFFSTVFEEIEVLFCGSLAACLNAFFLQTSETDLC